MKTFQKSVLLKQIGSRLRKLKIDNDKTSKELASFLNITTQAYGNIERGESDVCISKIITLAAYYKIPVSELLPEDYRDFRKNEHVQLIQELFAKGTSQFCLSAFATLCC